MSRILLLACMMVLPGIAACAAEEISVSVAPMRAPEEAVRAEICVMIDMTQSCTDEKVREFVDFLIESDERIRYLWCTKEYTGSYNQIRTLHSILVENAAMIADGIEVDEVIKFTAPPHLREQWFANMRTRCQRPEKSI